MTIPFSTIWWQLACITLCITPSFGGRCVEEIPKNVDVHVASIGVE
jgi:hypothetical protein